MIPEAAEGLYYQRDARPNTLSDAGVCTTWPSL
jgi:hypothetical protein